jgi:putative oxidoreductase
MVVSTFQRTKGWQRMTDFTSRLKALPWFPMLLLCLSEGMVFVDAGRHKLCADLAGFGTFFVALGRPFPSVMAVAVARREFGGGLCLILGLGTRVAAFAEAVIMAKAIWTVQLTDVQSFSAFLFLSEVPVYRYCCVARLHRRGHHKPR